MTSKAYRSAVSGEYVTAEYAAEHPDTTVAEEVAGSPIDMGTSGSMGEFVPDTGLAVDREALYRVIYEHLYNNSASDITDAIIASGILRSVAEVEHAHGERIANAIGEMESNCLRKANDGERTQAQQLNWSNRAGAHRAAMKVARDLSPPP